MINKKVAPQKSGVKNIGFHPAVGIVFLLAYRLSISPIFWRLKKWRIQGLVGVSLVTVAKN